MLDSTAQERSMRGVVSRHFMIVVLSAFRECTGTTSEEMAGKGKEACHVRRPDSLNSAREVATASSFVRRGDRESGGSGAGGRYPGCVLASDLRECG